MLLSSLFDVYAAVESDIISTGQAVEVVCMALKMLYINNTPLTKEKALKEINKLDIQIAKYNEKPIFFAFDGFD